MVHYGLCLRPLRFRLQCILLLEEGGRGGVGIVDWEEADIQVRCMFTSASLISTPPTWTHSFSHSLYQPLLRRKLLLAPHISLSVFLWKWKAIPRVWKTPEKTHSSWSVEGEQRAQRASPDLPRIILGGQRGPGSNFTMDKLALEAKGVATSAESEKKAAPRTKPKTPKKPKRTVFFEVEIIDLKTKEKLLLLDKVSVATMKSLLVNDIQY